MKAAAFKGWVAMAALASVGGAHAQTSFPPGPSVTGQLILSTDALGGLSTSGSVVEAPATWPAESGVGRANTASYSRATGVVSANFSNLSIDGNRLSSLWAPDALLSFRRTLLDDDGVPAETLRVYLLDISVDLGTSTVYAHLYARHSNAAPLVALSSRQAIFTATVPGVVGGTEGELVYNPGLRSFTVSGGLAGELKLNQTAADIILTNLAISPTSAQGRLLSEANWGTFSFATAVPEPSTYAMFGIGLLAVGALARRRQATA